MDNDVRELVESAEFERFHQERQAPRFNVFDVLRNAEYEIRHSNVLAWLLTPGETHGLGDKFLRGFIEKTRSETAYAQVGFCGTERVKATSKWRENSTSPTWRSSSTTTRGHCWPSRTRSAPCTTPRSARQETT